MRTFLISRKKELTALAIYFVLYMAAFAILEKVVTPEYIIHTRLDNLIPFTKWALIPYVAWFLWVPLVYAWLLIKDRKGFWTLFRCMALGSAIALSIYALFPNGVNLRHAVVGDDLMSQAVRLLYSIDTSTNVCPSLHVYVSLIVCIATFRTETLRKWRPLNLLLCISICASTVLLDQHSLIDVACGVVLFVVVDGIVELAEGRLQPTRSMVS